MPNNAIDFLFPTSERKYILAMLCCTMQEDKNISVISYNTLYFLQLQIEVHIEQSVCQHPNYSDAQPGHHLSDIGMFALFICKKTS